MIENIIKSMIQDGHIDHGHFEFGNMHTDNFVKNNFIYNHKIAEFINMALYNVIKDIQFEEIIALDKIALVLSYPISLILKRNLYNNKLNNDKTTIAIASIIKPETFEDITKQIKLTTSIIICLVNYSGNNEINGIPIVDILNINTWKSIDCPYCKDITNE